MIKAGHIAVIIAFLFVVSCSWQQPVGRAYSSLGAEGLIIENTELPVRQGSLISFKYAPSSSGIQAVYNKIYVKSVDTKGWKRFTLLPGSYSPNPDWSFIIPSKSYNLVSGTLATDDLAPGDYVLWLAFYEWGGKAWSKVKWVKKDVRVVSQNYCSVPATTKCDGEKLITCSSENIWVASDCEFGCYSDSAKVRCKECLSGNKKCVDSDTLQVCGSDFLWSMKECDLACENDDCITFIAGSPDIDEGTTSPDNEGVEMPDSQKPAASGPCLSYSFDRRWEIKDLLPADKAAITGSFNDFIVDNNGKIIVNAQGIHVADDSGYLKSLNNEMGWAVIDRFGRMYQRTSPTTNVVYDETVSPRRFLYYENVYSMKRLNADGQEEVIGDYTVRSGGSYGAVDFGWAFYQSYFRVIDSNSNIFSAVEDHLAPGRWFIKKYNSDGQFVKSINQQVSFLTAQPDDTIWALYRRSGSGGFNTFNEVKLYQYSNDLERLKTIDLRLSTQLPDNVLHAVRSFYVSDDGYIYLSTSGNHPDKNSPPAILILDTDGNLLAKVAVNPLWPEYSKNHVYNPVKVIVGTDYSLYVLEDRREIRRFACDR